MSRLKAVKPEIVEVPKPKFLLSGKAGIGKTWLALEFPAPYYIDTEGGAVRPQYRKKLEASGGVYMGKEQGSQDFHLVIEELKTLATEKHSYKTLVIDSFSFLYNLAASIAEEKVGSDYGRDKKEANKPTRQLMRYIEQVDMTVILICHQKDKWERKGKDILNVGTTFDGFDKLEYVLDLWLELSKDVSSKRIMVVKKSRIDTFPEGLIIPTEYSAFAKVYGTAIMEKESVPVTMAKPDQVVKIKSLIETVKLPDDFVEKLFTKADVDSWEELTEEQIVKTIEFCEKKLNSVKEAA